MTGTGETERWAPGDQILWRYRGNGPLRHGPAPGRTPNPVHICRPVTVVQDTDELLAVWVAPGTECVKPVLANGTEVHAEPLATRYTSPRTTARSPWLGNGVLKLARPGEPWSVWLFWEQGWQFRSWYVNLEEPRTRWRPAASTPRTISSTSPSTRTAAGSGATRTSSPRPRRSA